MLTSQNFGSWVNGVAFHPTKNVLASCSNDRTIKLWNTDTGAELSTLRGDKPVNCVAFSPDGDMLAAGDGDNRAGNVRLYDVQTGEVKSTLRGHSKNNPECTCKHDAGIFRKMYQRNPECPVTGHTRYVPTLSCSACFLSRVGC